MKTEATKNTRIDAFIVNFQIVLIKNLNRAQTIGIPLTTHLLYAIQQYFSILDFRHY